MALPAGGSATPALPTAPLATTPSHGDAGSQADPSAAPVAPSDPGQGSQQGQGQDDGGNQQGEGGNATGSGKGKGKGKSKGKGKGKNKGNKGGEPNDGPKPSPNPPSAPGSNAKMLIGEAKKLKAKMEKVFTSASDLIQAVSTQKEWQWANNDVNLMATREKKMRLEKLKTKNPFWCDWTVQAPVEWEKIVRKTNSPAVIEVTLQEGLPEMERAIDDLGEEIEMLKDMHIAKMRRSRVAVSPAPA